MAYLNPSGNGDVYLIAGSEIKKDGGAVIGNCSSTSLLDNISISNKYSVGKDGRADFTSGMTTISLSSPLPVSGIVDYSGYVAIDTGLPAVSSGVSLSVSGEYPVNGVYNVVDVVGTLAITESKYFECMSGVDVSSYWVSSGVPDPVNPSQKIQFVDCNVSSPSTQGLGVHSSSGAYVARTHVNSWDCFNGSLDPCDITIENIQLGLDQSLTTKNMHFSEPCGPKEKNSSGYPQTPGSDNP